MHIHLFTSVYFCSDELTLNVGVVKKTIYINKLKVNMQRMSNQVKNMRALLLIVICSLIAQRFSADGFINR